MELNYYDKNAQSFFNDSVNINLDDLYGTFLSPLDKGAHILDAGCGSGRDSKVFINKGYKVTSFDSSAELVKLASKHIGIQVKLMDFSQLDENNTYDGIWACASLIHV
ncbi:MAG: class I SAM-dependent methyltransferase, partial [Desulfobacteraceae bacterium]|nr:class I SAM-dependent methyltransferase [Desulfobacteraceae bacterium]